jgi:DHA1 family bicyclomycin/chloramphenicol resistance-like MFS transporter
MPHSHNLLGISRRQLAAILGLLAMIGPFAIDSIFPAFRVLAHELRVDDAAIQQAISIYLLGYALMSLLHGALSDAYGRKPVIIAGLLLFLASSVGCALADSLPQLLVFRFIQGLSAGVGLIVGRAVIRDVYQGDDAQRMMSLVSMIFSIAPAIAPIIGGYILNWSNWQGIFWFLVALSFLMLLVVGFLLPESHPADKRVPIHPVSLSKSYWSMGKSSEFRMLAFSGTLLFGALFIYIASAPDYVLLHLRLTETQFGYFFVPTIAGMSVGAFISGRLAGIIPGRTLVNIGFSICALSMLGNLIYCANVVKLELPWAVLPLSGLAFGIALVFPIVTIALLDLYPTIRGTASSMQAFVSLMSNALIAGLLAPMVSKNPLLMALVSCGFVATGYFFWWRYQKNTPVRIEGAEQAMAYEPTDEL